MNIYGNTKEYEGNGEKVVDKYNEHREVSRDILMMVNADVFRNGFDPLLNHFRRTPREHFFSGTRSKDA